MPKPTRTLSLPPRAPAGPCGRAPWSPGSEQALELDGLPRRAAEELARVSTPVQYVDGAIVYAHGDTLPGLLVVARGALRLFSVDGSGTRTLVLDVLGPGACAGGLQVFGGGAALGNAEAVGETLCRVIPARALRLAAARNNEVALCMMRHFAATVRRLLSLAQVLSLQSVPERVGTLILDHHDPARKGRLVEFHENQDALAQRIGTCREALCRGLKLMAELGLIRNSFPVVRILDLEGLRRFARGISHEPAHRLSS